MIPSIPPERAAYIYTHHILKSSPGYVRSYAWRYDHRHRSRGRTWRARSTYERRTGRYAVTGVNLFPYGPAGRQAGGMPLRRMHHCRRCCLYRFREGSMVYALGASIRSKVPRCPKKRKGFVDLFVGGCCLHQRGRSLNADVILLSSDGNGAGPAPVGIVAKMTTRRMGPSGFVSKTYSQPESVWID